MGIFFGTDGIRGVACEELNFDLAFKCGNAVASEKKNTKIIIGRDTRVSGIYLSTAFAVGAMSAGANVIDIGICPTPGIAYITKKLNADFGVVISASHNPPKYNGIKIFNSKGYKLCDKDENSLERKFVKQISVPFNDLGCLKQDASHVQLYINHLKKCCKTNLNGMKIVIDGSNGASYKIAPIVFESLGAKVTTLSCDSDGIIINENCGALFPENLCKKVVEMGADFGFAFDGDADRIIACDENGKILDGDILTYILAKELKKENKLSKNIVVGTRHTNMGLENDLKDLGISLERTDIGDKYVLEKMLHMDLQLGGEKSGHIILSEYATTGDGILCAILISEICKSQNKKLSEISSVKLYPQCNIDVVVSDKMRVINSEKLSHIIAVQENKLKNNSRIMVRVSGTEPKVRIMVESLDFDIAKKCAEEIESVVKEIDGRCSCVE